MDALIIRESDESVLLCVASILRNMLFVTKIWIVAKTREVGLWSKVGESFPDNSIPVEMIAPDDLDYRKLSDPFLLIKENILAVSPITEKHFLQDGKTVIYGAERKKAKGLFHKSDNLESRIAEILGTTHCVTSRGAPVMIHNGFIREFFKGSDEVFANCITGKENMDISTLQCTKLDKDGVCILKADDEELKSLCTADDEILWETLQAMRGKAKALFCTIAPKEIFDSNQRRAIFDWARERFGLKV